ncbi:MAG: hypothetical protein KatS3mg057_0670 [Herpetosiphonaceae bacterium]|nr:MAG: hypothetical protein KatS3mg057_0670 [Herpetosiphonaceae bacterium]
MNLIRQREGQSLVEIALCLPILLVLLLGIVELAILFSVYVGMTGSAREGARAGAIYQYSGSTPSLNDQTACTTFAATLDAERSAEVNQAITSTLNPIIDPARLQVDIAYLESPCIQDAFNPSRAAQIINVTLSYTHTIFFGLFGRNDIALSAQSSMRIEPGGGK